MQIQQHDYIFLSQPQNIECIFLSNYLSSTALLTSLENVG